MKKLQKRLCASLCAGMLMLTGCSTQEQDTSFTVTDQSGREVSFDQPAETAASGYYISTTILLGLGQADKLTGVEMKAETRPIYEASASEILELPALGNKKQFNVEECAKADPDVVFLPLSLESYVDQLEELDIKAILLEPETSEGFVEAVEIIGEVMGCSDRVEEFFAYEDKLLEEYEMDGEEEATVYFASGDVLSSAAEDMYQNEILEYANAENAIHVEGSNWVNIDIETLLAADPDYIFIESGDLSVESFTEDARFSTLKAVQNNNVYVFPSNLETWDTPGLSSCLGKLWAASIINPERISLDQVKEEAKAFYQEFYGFEATDVELGF